MLYLIASALSFAIFCSCATALPRSVVSVERGTTKEQVIARLGHPQDRQFKGDIEAWQYCQTGFVNDSFVIVWFAQSKVTGVNTYKDSVADIGFCDSHFRTVRWEDAPDMTIEIRDR